MSSSPPDDVLSWENLIYVADLLSTSGERHISLLGGEPSLHPDFTDIIVYLLERDFHVSVFTSGIMPKGKLEELASCLADAPLEKISFVCNLNSPAISSAAEVEAVKRFLGTMGARVAPGYNIHEIDFDLDFLLQYINQFGLQRFLRIGVAHPVLGAKNVHIAVSDMEKVADRLNLYMPLFERLRIKPGLDCGFLLCTFTDEQLGRFFRIANGNIKFGCGPAVDIGPDMSVWSCFPLSSFHKKSIFDFNSFQEIVGYYQDLHAKMRMETGGVYEKCDDCVHREEKLCEGGCLSHILLNFRGEPGIRIAEVIE